MKKRALLVLLLVIVACHDNKRVATPLAAIPTPQITPTPEPDYTLPGTAFIKLNRGSDKLAGMKVQLVDADAFIHSFEKLQDKLLVRFLAFQIHQLQNDSGNQQADIETWTTKLAGLEAQYKEFLDAKWSSFIYEDPFTGRKIEGSWFKGGTSNLMRSNIEKIKSIISGDENNMAANSAAATNHLRVIREHGQEYRQDDDLSLINRVPGILGDIQDEHDLVFHSTRDIIETLDKNTLDEAVLDEDARFTFPHVKRKSVICYAQHIAAYDSKQEVMCWIVKVKWDPEGPRKVILANQNSLEYGDWFKDQRPESLTVSMRKWLNTFK
jgi:hypothetical protein